MSAEPLDLLGFREHLAQYHLLASGKLDAKLDELNEKLGLVRTVEQANQLMKRAAQDLEQAQRGAAQAVQAAREDVEKIRQQADAALARATTQSAETSAALLAQQEREAIIVHREKELDERERALLVKESVLRNKLLEHDKKAQEHELAWNKKHEENQEHARRLTSEENALKAKANKIRELL